MSKHVVLMKFTDKGLANIKKSPERAAAFRATAEKAGARVAAQLWTTGPYDALMIFDAPDEATAAGLVLGLAKDGNVTTCMHQAFDADSFGAVLGKTA